MSKPFTVYRPWIKLTLLDLLVRVASVLMPLKSARPVDTLGQHQIYLFSRAERLFYNYSQRPVANEGVSRVSRDLFEGINPHFASNLTTSFESLGQHPGVNTEHTPFFVEGGDQDFPKQSLYYLTDSILETVQQSVGNFTTYWSHKNTFAEGSCNSVGLHPLRAKYSPNSGEPVLHESPDLWVLYSIVRQIYCQHHTCCACTLKKYSVQGLYLV
jgi:hypothetical protein